MSNKDFWEEDPELLWAYRKSYLDKFKLQKEVNNFVAWLNGVYVFNAIQVGIYNSFGRKDNQPALNYYEQPIDFNAKPKSKEELIREKRLQIEERIKERNREIKEMLKQKK